MIHGAERANKKVLMIAYAFPPLGGSGVQRTLKFAKYLPQNGWLPIVLTGDGSYGGYTEERDASLLSEFPREGQIIRVKYVQPLSLYRKHLLRHRRHSGATVGSAEPGEEPARLSERCANVLKQGYHRWLCIPDAYAPWFPFALVAALRAVRTQSIDLVFSTSDPYTDHLVGYAINRLTGKPWVADFRDPWTLNPDYEHHDSVRGKIDRTLERLFVDNAAGTTVVSEGMRQQMISMSKVPAQTIAVITNGFDEEDFEQSVHHCTGKFTVAYVGRFAARSNVSPIFLEALRELLNEDPEMDLHVVFVGHFGRDNENLVRELNLEGCVHRLGYLPHSEATKHMQKADALLLTLTSDDADLRPTGKIFEYLAARRPILGMVPVNGLAAQIIKETESGVTVGPRDVPGIKRAIRRMYEQHRMGALGLDPNSPIQQYSRAHLTTKLAAFFDEIMSCCDR